MKREAPSTETRMLPQSFWELGASVDTQGNLTSPKVESAGTGVPLPRVGATGYGSQSSLGLPTKSNWRWIVPLLALTASAAAITAYQLTREKTPATAVTPSVDGGSSSDAAISGGTPGQKPFEPVSDLPALVTQVRRVLRQGIQGTSAEVRRACVRGAGELRDDDTKALLVSVLKMDPEQSVRTVAALALAELGDPELGPVLKTVRDQSSELMQVSVDEALARLGDHDGRRGLHASLKSAKPGIALAAALTLAELNDARARPLLESVIARADEQNQGTILASLTALAKLGHAKARESLYRGLQTSRELDRLAFAEALLKLGDDRAHSALRQLALKGEMATRLVAAKLLASGGDYAHLDLMNSGIRASEIKTRLLAAAGFGAVIDKSALPPLAEALRDKEEQVRATAAESLARILGQMPAALIRRSQNWVLAALENQDWSVRYAAVNITSVMDPQVAVELLGWAFRDKDPRVRAAAVARLAKLQKPTTKAVELLRAAMLDTSAEVRHSATRALGTLAGSSAKDALDNAVRDRSPMVGMAAAGQLLALGDTTYLKDLRRASEAKQPTLRSAAVRAIAHWKDARAETMLSRALKDRSPAVRLAAALALAERGSKQGLAELRKASASSGEDQAEALRALNRLALTPKDREQNIQVMASSSAPLTRKLAIESASQLEPKHSGTILGQGAADRSVEVRRATAVALSRMATRVPGADRILTRLSKDSDPAVRAAAAIGLARLGRTGAVSLAQPDRIKPAPVPKLTPRAKESIQPPRSDKAQLFVITESSSQQSYKYHVTRAELAARLGKYTDAERHLKAAQSSGHGTSPALLFEYAQLNLRRAIRESDSKRRSRYLRSARSQFGSYLQRAPGGELAERARKGLRDVARLSKDKR
jgi:HEAT repeat protein